MATAATRPPQGSLPAPRARSRRVGAALLACVPLVAAAWALGLALHYRAGLTALHGASARALPWCAAGLLLAALVTLRACWRQGRPGALALARALLAGAVLGTLAWAARVPSEELLARLGLALALAVPAAWTMLLALAPARGPFRRALRVADFALFQLALLALLGELALGSWAAHGGPPWLAQPGERAEALLERWRMPPGKLHLGFPADARGAYDRPAPSPEERARSGERLVVVIGDSFSVGVVPLPFHYTKLADERLPGVRIYNFGVVSVGPSEYELMVRETRALRPDLYVIALFVGNDLGAGAEPGTSAWRRWLDGRRRYALSVPRRLAELARERARVGGGRAAAVQGEQARPAERSREALLREMPWLADPALEEGTFSEEAFLAMERTRARSWAGGEAELFAQTTAQLGRLREAAGDVPLALLLVPDEAQVEDGLWRQVEAALDAEVGHERERAQRRLLAWCAAQGVECEDLLPRLRAQAPLADGARHLYQLRDTHWNARGNSVAADGLLALIERALPPPGGAPAAR